MVAVPTVVAVSTVVAVPTVVGVSTVVAVPTVVGVIAVCGVGLSGLFAVPPMSVVRGIGTLSVCSVIDGVGWLGVGEAGVHGAVLPAPWGAASRPRPRS
jgi:hypothetical protein